MSNETMIDRVAREIEGAIDIETSDARIAARAAIAAMREPLGLTCMHGITMSEQPSQTCLCHTAFSGLIDAALGRGRL